MNSSSSSKFRFRDHKETGDSMDGGTSSESSSVSSDGDDELEVESMTGKGIKRLCSELVELKKASDKDFHKNIFSNYSAFLRIFQEVEGMESELIQLKHHVSTQKRLVKDLTYGIYLDFLSKETIESIIKEPVCAEQSPLSTLEAHTIDVSETLDTLLSEYRLDEALTILEMEAETFLRMQLEESYPPDMLMSYNLAMSGRKALLADQLILVAENPRVAAPELQKALVGLCRLGHSHYATKLLLKYYHTRLATGIHNFEHSESLPHGAYIRVLAKFVFSMISQAAKSFVVLYGETSPYASELIQWACEETQVFASCFIKFVTSISEISGGLSTAVEAVQFALSYCSLLETQRIVLRPFFIKHVRPCMEEVLQIRIEHFKKVVAIFAATDAWDLGRYLVSGILNEGCPSLAVGQQPEYCLLTNSGRKFVTLLQAITEDVSPLVSLQMEGPILRGLTNLLLGYIARLEIAITCETNVTETGGSIINLAESLQQQVSVLANLSTLEQFFSSIIKSILKGISNFNCEIIKTPLVGCEQKDLALCLLLIQEASDQLRASFCQQFIYKMMSPESGCRPTPETCGISYGDFNVFHGMMPSVVLQVLFLELRKLEKLAEGIIEMEWLMELLKAMMEARFAWTLNNKDISTTSEDDLIVQHPGNFKQFVLDIQFLVEIARYEGYLSNNIINASLDFVSRMESAFLSAGLDPRRDLNEDDGWATKAATETIQRLLEMKTELPPNEETTAVREGASDENQSVYATDSFQDDASSCKDSLESEMNAAAIDTIEVGINKEAEVLDIELAPLQMPLGFLEEEGGSCDNGVIHATDIIVASKDMAEIHDLKRTKVHATLVSAGIVGEASAAELPIEKGNNNHYNGSGLAINRLDMGGEEKSPGSQVAEDSVKLQDQNGRNNVNPIDSII